MKDLRSFLAEWEQKHPTDVVRISKETSVIHEITSLAARLEKDDFYPILVFENPVNSQGKRYSMPVVTNLLASRKRCAAAVGLDPREIACGFAAKTALSIDPQVVKTGDAPVKEVIKKGKDVDLYEIPVLSPYLGCELTPRFTGAMATSIDPVTGIDNCALQSLNIRGKDELNWRNAGITHNSLNMEAWWARGEDCPVAFWIGHHPAASLGGQQKLSHPQSHYPGIGGLMGEALRLVPTETFGEKLLVPAEAEIVMEGYALKDRFESSGYGGDHAKTMIPMGIHPVVRVTCITQRKDALYHDITVGYADNLVMGGFAMEATVYEICRRVSPTVVNVHLPLSGLCRRIVNIQVKDPAAGEPRAIIAAALTLDNRIKYVYVVDEDVDIFDDREMTVAFVNRCQIDRDMLVLPGLPDSAIDPIAIRVDGAMLTAKAGFDLTLPPPPLPGFPKQFEEPMLFPQNILEKPLEDYIGSEELHRLEKESQ